jgi:hypothetical protein
VKPKTFVFQQKRFGPRHGTTCWSLGVSLVSIQKAVTLMLRSVAAVVFTEHLASGRIPHDKRPSTPESSPNGEPIDGKVTFPAESLKPGGTV